MSTALFSVTEALAFGWRVARKRFWFFLQIIAIMLLVAYGPAVIMESFDRTELPTLAVLLFALAGVAFWVLQLVVSVGLVRIVLALVDGRPASLEDFFDGVRFVVGYFFGSLLYGLLVIAGLVLLVVPGVVFAVRFQLYLYLIVDRELGPVAALKESWRMTRGTFWNLVLLWLAALGVNILGIAALGVGLLWSIPTTMLATGWVYRRLSQRHHA
ncbi:MAG: DUF975 family protein [Parcubacteria group bacterium]|nr:DUF975 family protein [Parcubacteria group bacterium]